MKEKCNSLFDKELNTDCTENKQRQIDNRNSTPPFQNISNMVMMVNHLGILLFSSILIKIEQKFEHIGWIVKQWFVAILLEAVNIEQTKLLDYRSLNIFLGQTIQTLYTQRTILREISIEKNVEKILRLNAKEVEIEKYQDFYYDPHVKRYTGKQKILKGWCGKIRIADKIVNMDFIHTEAGHPVYIEHTDNYDDLRERFSNTIVKFRGVVDIRLDKEISVVVDRGIYDIKVFKNIIADKFLHIVTWEKDYKPGIWNDESRIKHCIITKTRNNNLDIRIYRFKYQEEDWDRDNKMKLIRVIATNPQNKSIEVGILTDDKNRNGYKIIQLMFNRWLQENDFKYLGDHFGINEITSYAVIPYKKLKQYIADKKMKNKEYEALEKARRKIKVELGKCLVQQRNKRRPCKELQERIAGIDKKIENITEQLKKTEKEISKLDYLIEKHYMRLNTQAKRFMDSIKILARNAFYKSMTYFKEEYNNYRDDHVIYRNLIKSSGLVVQQENMIKIFLIPTYNYSPKLKKVINKTLNKFNETNPIFPDGSGRIFQLYLTKKAGIKLAIV